MTINSKVELVFIPTPRAGHLYSAVKMARHIIQRDHNISILVLILDLSTNPHHSDSINDFINSQSRQNPYPTRLSFLTLPPLSDTTSPSVFHAVTLHIPLVKHAIQERTQQPGSTPVVGFILDMFCTAMMDVADYFNVPTYIYLTSGANFLNLWLHLQSLVDDGVDIITEFSDPNTELCSIPGFVNRVTSKVIPREFLDDKGLSMLLVNHARGFRKCKGILINTYMELEPFGIKALEDEVAKKNVPKIYPVGPILDLEYKSLGSRSKNNEQESIVEWLNHQPLSSVVFLCFGSRGSFDADQVKELANGLEKSGHRFLWSFHNLSPLDALPQGFLERTASRGKIIGWAPQILVLSHPAVGGFVSHCGWNSTLESLWFGVPIGTWPLYAEQQMNAFELVKELGLAVEIQIINNQEHDSKTTKGERNNNVVTAEEVENGVKKLMSLDEEMKNKVSEMRDKSRKALEEGGSSHKWFGCFIEDVLSNYDTSY